MLKQIEKAFTEVDTKMFERQLEWAKGRIQAVKDYEPKKMVSIGREDMTEK